MKTTVLLMAGITAVGMMTSCASDNGDSPIGKSGKENVTLSFTTGNTRTTGIVTDDGNEIGQKEGKVNNVALGFFDANGNRTNAELSNNSLVTDFDMSGITPGTNINESFTTSSNASTIIAIANVPTGQFTATNSTAYLSNYTDLLSNTTSDNGTGATNHAATPTTVNSQKITGLPMYGQGTISSNAASISLERMVDRICLTGLSVDFTKSTDVTATFKPTEIYMYNVNDALTVWGTTPTTHSTMTEPTAISTSGTWGACEVTNSNATTPALIATMPNTAYLSSGLLSLDAKITNTYISGDATSANAYSFYVFPNTNTSKPTKIIIKGVYTPTGGSAAIVYYPITINCYNSNTTLSKNGGSALTVKASDDSQTSANTLYNLSVAIEGRGVPDPTQSLAPSTVAVTMSVAIWNKTSQSVTVK